MTTKLTATFLKWLKDDGHTNDLHNIAADLNDRVNDQRMEAEMDGEEIDELAAAYEVFEQWTNN